jgi:hypothetical protein
MQEKQEMRYSDAELSLIKNTFKDKDVLKSLRKAFLQKESTEQFATKEVLDVIKKTFLPEVDGDAPIHQVVDLWLTLKFKEMPVDHAYPIIKARKILVDYFAQEIEQLSGADKTRGIKLSDLETITDDIDETFINFVARNEIITHIEQQISQLHILANNSMEDLLKAIEKNSTK